MRRGQGALIEIAHEIQEKNQFLRLRCTRYARRSEFQPEAYPGCAQSTAA
jgi:hypothetical protein